MHVDPSDPCVSVALVVNHIPGVGVIYDVTADVVYSGRHGGVLLINGKPCDPLLSTTHSDDDSPIVTNISPPDAHEADAYREHVSGTISNLLRSGHFNFRIESCPARCLLMVATGRASVYWACGPKAEEVAAGLVLARAAGALATNPGNKDNDSMTSPTWTAIAAAEAREKGYTGEPRYDLTARRFVVGVSSTARKRVERQLAGPIPFSVCDDDHPLADDLQLRKVVLGMDPEEANTSVEPLYNTRRWSDAPGSEQCRTEASPVPVRITSPATPQQGLKVEPAAVPRNTSRRWSVFDSMRRKSQELPPVTLDKGYEDDGYLRVAPSEDDGDTSDHEGTDNKDVDDDDDDDDDDNELSVPPPPQPLKRREADHQFMLSDVLSVDEDDGLGMGDRHRATSGAPKDDYALTAHALNETARELGLGRPIDKSVDTNGWVNGGDGTVGRVDIRVHAPRVKPVLVAPAAAKDEADDQENNHTITTVPMEARPDVRRIRVRSYLDE